MKKFEFHLEKLLTYKDQMLDSELMTLGVLQTQLNKALNRLTALELESEQCKRKLEKAMIGDIDPSACQIHKNYIEHLKEMIEKSQQEVDLLTQQVNDQIEVVKKLKLDTKSLEIIKDSRFEEYKKEDLKLTEKQLDEFVNTAKLMKMSS